MVPDQDADVAVPMSLVEALFASVAGAIHDRPVQSVLAGRLLVESGIGDDAADDLVQRGLQSITAAGEQARDLMWALGPVQLRSGHLEEDIADAVARMGRPAGLDVRVTLDPDVPIGAVRALLQSVHAVLVDVLVAGGRASRVTVADDAEGVRAVVIADAGSSGDGPWVRLARLRVGAAGGRVAVHRDGDAHTITVEVPSPDAG